MTDEHLRALERRWQETNSAEDWAAFARAQVRAGAGIVLEAIAFLEEARALALTVKRPGLRAVALAQVAWACLELDRGALALVIVGDIERATGDPSGRDVPWAALALARVGAVQGRMRDAFAARASLNESLRRIFSVWSGENSSQRDVDARQGLVGWFRAVADAELSDTTFARDAWDRSTRRQFVTARIVDQSRDALVRLGLGEVARTALWDGLQQKGLQRWRSEVADLQYPDEAFKCGLQDALKGLMLLPRGATVDHARRVLEFAVEFPGSIDEFSTETLVVALKAVSEEEAWAAVEDALSRLEPSFEAVRLRLAVIDWIGVPNPRACALHAEGMELSRPEGPLGEDWHRGLTRLVRRIPTVYPGAQALKRLEEVGQPNASLSEFEQNEVWLAVAESLSRVEGKGARALLGRTLERALERARAASGPGWLLFEGLDACLRVTESLGSSETTRAASALVREAATNAIRAQGPEEGDWYYCRSLSRVAFCVLGLGDREAFEEDFETVVEWSAALDPYDKTELLEDMARSCGRAHPAVRAALSRRVLQLGSEVVATRNQDQFAVDWLSTLCADVVRFES